MHAEVKGALEACSAVSLAKQLHQAMTAPSSKVRVLWEAVRVDCWVTASAKLVEG